jgi:hypothetical protein
MHKNLASCPGFVFSHFSRIKHYQQQAIHPENFRDKKKPSINLSERLNFIYQLFTYSG